MTWMETTAIVLRMLAFVVLYAFVGFGPGFVVGLLAANAIFGKGKPYIYLEHEENKKSAAQHNAQWNPSNPRWRK